MQIVEFEPIKKTDNQSAGGQLFGWTLQRVLESARFQNYGSEEQSTCYYPMTIG